MSSTHTLLTADIIARRALQLLRNNMVMGARVFRGYEEEFPGNVRGYKVGDSISIQKPVKFKATTARTRGTSSITEQSITLQVATQKHVSWQFNSKDLTMDISKYSKKYIEPAAMVLANEVDADLCSLYKDVYNAVYESTGFVTPESFIVLGKAGQRLDEEAVPMDQRCLVLNPAANWSLANAFKNMFVTDVSGKALKKGYLAKIANMEIYMDQNIKTHTTGDYHDSGSTAAVQLGTGGTGIPSTGQTDGPVPGTDHKTLITVGHRMIASELLNTGDVFTISGVYAVNPVSGDSTGTLRQFVVTSDVDCTNTSVGHPVTLAIEPGIVATGPYKTVDTVPSSGASVTFLGNQGEPYPQNLAFHKNAFALVMVPLQVPEGVSFASSASDNGVSIRVVKDYNIDNDDEVVRMDILYGIKTLYPELAVRLLGAEG